MPLSEQQEYVNQISLFHSKLVHLEETLKIEETEAQLKKKLEFHKQNSIREANLLAKNQQEHAEQQIELEKEEGHRKAVMQKMLTINDEKFAPIQNFLVNLEGISKLFITCPNLSQLLISRHTFTIF